MIKIFDFKMFRYYFPISKFTSSVVITSQLILLSRFSSSSKSHSYSLDDFLNEDLDQIVKSEQQKKEMMMSSNVGVSSSAENLQTTDIHENNNNQQQQQKKQTPAPPKSMNNNKPNVIITNSRNTVEAARNAMRSGGVVSAFAPPIGGKLSQIQNDNTSTPHSLSEFLFACNELVVEAKQKQHNHQEHQQMTNTTQKVEHYWK